MVDEWSALRRNSGHQRSSITQGATPKGGCKDGSPLKDPTNRGAHQVIKLVRMQPKRLKQTNYLGFQRGLRVRKRQQPRVRVYQSLADVAEQ